MGVTSSVAAPCDTNPSDATGVTILYLRHVSLCSRLCIYKYKIIAKEWRSQVLVAQKLKVQAPNVQARPATALLVCVGGVRCPQVKQLYTYVLILKCSGGYQAKK